MAGGRGIAQIGSALGAATTQIISIEEKKRQAELQRQRIDTANNIVLEAIKKRDGMVKAGKFNDYVIEREVFKTIAQDSTKAGLNISDVAGTYKAFFADTIPKEKVGEEEVLAKAAQDRSKALGDHIFEMAKDNNLLTGISPDVRTQFLQNPLSMMNEVPGLVKIVNRAGMLEDAKDSNALLTNTNEIGMQKSIDNVTRMAPEFLDEIQDIINSDIRNNVSLEDTKAKYQSMLNRWRSTHPAFNKIMGPILAGIDEVIDLAHPEGKLPSRAKTAEARANEAKYDLALREYAMKTEMFKNDPNALKYKILVDMIKGVDAKALTQIGAERTTVIETFNGLIGSMGPDRARDLIKQDAVQSMQILGNVNEQTFVPTEEGEGDPEEVDYLNNLLVFNDIFIKMNAKDSSGNRTYPGAELPGVDFSKYSQAMSTLINQPALKDNVKKALYKYKSVLKEKGELSDAKQRLINNFIYQMENPTWQK